MQFICSEELHPGLRLAKPIYSKEGVLLCERGSTLTAPAIQSIHKYDIHGVYILESVEPVPSYTQSDLAFEQAQAQLAFKLKLLYEKVRKRESLDTLPALVEDVIKRYGKIESRINFNPNVRGPQDFIYKHTLSMTVLCAIIGQHMNLSEEDFTSLIAASLLFSFGYRFVPKEIMQKKEPLDDTEYESIQAALEKGTNYLNANMDHFDFLPDTLAAVTYCILTNGKHTPNETPSEKALLFAEILRVAHEFDLRTSLWIERETQSEISAIYDLLAQPTKYNENIVTILAQYLHIFPTGAKILLSTSESAIVLLENPTDYMKPVILRRCDQGIYDLSDPSIGHMFQIVDTPKTLDNRIEIDEEILQNFEMDERIIALKQRHLPK